MNKMNTAWFTANGTFGKSGARPSALYLEEASDLRRFTVFGPAASGKTEALHPWQQEALDQLRAYITADLEATDHLRKTLLPPTPRVTIIQAAVRFVLLNWNKVWA